jgi:hypothetical protein
MKTISVVFVCMCMLLGTSSIFAIDTEVEIKTIQSGDISLRFLSKDTGKIIPGGEFFITADSGGNVQQTYTGIEDMVKLSVSVLGVSFDGVPLLVFKNIPTGKHILLDLTAPNPSPVITDIIAEEVEEEPEEVEEEPEEIVEEPEEPEEVVEEPEKTEQNSEGSNPLTGFAISGENTKKTALYSALVIGILAVFVFVFIMIHNKRENKGEKSDSAAADSEEKRELEDAERRIKQAEADISLIKNQDKIKEAEKKLQEDKDTLERLRSG